MAYRTAQIDNGHPVNGVLLSYTLKQAFHNHLMPDDDVMARRRFPRYWFFVRGTHRSPMDYPHTGPVM